MTKERSVVLKMFNVMQTAINDQGMNPYDLMYEFMKTLAEGMDMQLIHDIIESIESPEQVDQKRVLLKAELNVKH